MSVCPRSKRKMAPAINTKLGTRILYSTRRACTDPEVKRSKVKVTRLRKPLRRTVASDYSRHPVTLCCATCGRCRRGSACRYDCLCFLVLNSYRPTTYRPRRLHSIDATDVTRSVSVCVYVCWSQGCALQKRLNRSICRFDGNSGRPKEPCIRQGVQIPQKVDVFVGVV